MRQTAILPDSWDIGIPRLLLGGLVCTVLVALVVLGATSTSAFGLYNPAWDGTSELREQIADDSAVESELLTATAQYETFDPNTTVSFVIAPEQNYDTTEAEQVRQFTERGGTLVIFENFGESGNELLADLGTDARFDGRLLKDEQHNFRGPRFPVATTVENTSQLADVEQLTLNHATAIEPGNATVLVRSSEFAYLTADPDAELDDDDELTAAPVVVRESLGDGEVITVSDPSITINTMLEEPDNAAFLRAVYDGNETVVFDTSQSDDIPLLVNVLLAIRETPLLQVGIGFVGIAGLALLARRDSRPDLDHLPAQLLSRIPRLGSQSEPTIPAMTVEEQSAYLRSKHPDWDEERINRVIAAFNRDGGKDTDNE